MMKGREFGCDLQCTTMIKVLALHLALILIMTGSLNEPAFAQGPSINEIDPFPQYVYPYGNPIPSGYWEDAPVIGDEPVYPYSAQSYQRFPARNESEYHSDTYGGVVMPEYDSMVTLCSANPQCIHLFGSFSPSPAAFAGYGLNGLNDMLWVLYEDRRAKSRYEQARLDRWLYRHHHKRHRGRAHRR